jgi:hypothetical protein
VGVCLTVAAAQADGADKSGRQPSSGAAHTVTVTTGCSRESLQSAPVAITGTTWRNAMKRVTGTVLFGAGLLVGAALCLLPRAPLMAKSEAAQPSSLAARVQELEDHIAIERLLMQYGVALDSRDFATYSQLFAREGTWSGSIGTFKGPAAIKEAMEKAFRSDAPGPNGTFHLLTNPIIEVHGDRATAHSKWTFCRMAGTTPTIALAGSYEDTFVREGGVWRFSSRVASQATAAASK